MCTCTVPNARCCPSSNLNGRCLRVRHKHDQRNHLVRCKASLFLDPPSPRFCVGRATFCANIYCDYPCVIVEWSELFCDASSGFRTTSNDPAWPHADAFLCLGCLKLHIRDIRDNEMLRSPLMHPPSRPRNSRTLPVRDISGRSLPYICTVEATFVCGVAPPSKDPRSLARLPSCNVCGSWSAHARNRGVRGL